MNIATLKLLTWATVATAVGSAVLLAALGPEFSERIGAAGEHRIDVVPQGSDTPNQQNQQNQQNASVRSALASH